ncbi:extensin-like isoform X2 [Ananas comosus]|uniref:Extensin-like isoform X2 n=1 Tax=Ananas comosus TaxID=4615 RepID=A0A6P5GBF2_ANACO|nr:extensin-like isoform X2 [Ananas comosus]
MAAKMVVLLVFVLAAIAGWGLLSVQADSSCLNSLLSMTSCISYVSDESSEVSPLCCPSISAVLASQPLCLCYILNGEVGKLLGKPIDESRALGLPGLCKLTTPPISECNTMPLPPIYPGGPPTWPAPAPAPTLATPAPTPATPVRTPATPAPTPATPAPTPATPAPAPATPAPTPATPAPTPATPAPTPATPAPTQATPAPMPATPAPAPVPGPVPPPSCVCH